MTRTVCLPLPGGFDAARTFDCGQCFRWAPDPDGSWTGVVRGIPARVHSRNGECVLESPEPDLPMWKDYFDAGLDYGAVRASFITDEFTRAAAENGFGIRILCQDPWEALCSFLISQCNNIPRIRAILARLCEALGEPVPFEGRVLFSFPSPERLASLEPEELAFLRAGYRAPYLTGAARAVCSGALDFDRLAAMDSEEARRRIMELRGVGRKVADCFLLFGLHKLDAFPVDTWMKKADSVCPGGLAGVSSEPWAGIYQQYIFHYMRFVLQG